MRTGSRSDRSETGSCRRRQFCERDPQNSDSDNRIAEDQASNSLGMTRTYTICGIAQCQVAENYGSDRRNDQEAQHESDNSADHRGNCVATRRSDRWSERIRVHDTTARTTASPRYAAPISAVNVPPKVISSPT